jgi:hypothetical protein
MYVLISHGFDQVSVLYSEMNHAAVGGFRQALAAYTRFNLDCEPNSSIATGLYPSMVEVNHRLQLNNYMQHIYKNQSSLYWKTQQTGTEHQWEATALSAYKVPFLSTSLTLIVVNSQRCRIRTSHCLSPR